LYTNVEEITGEECLAYYLKRWKVEEDFNKMKDL
jgi:transposase